MKTTLKCLAILIFTGSLFAQNPVKRDLQCQAAGASGTTYACSIATAPSAYVTGERYWFLADVANTGAATINFNSLGAKSIKKVQGGVTTALVANDLQAGQWVSLTYDGTNMQMTSQLGNSATSTTIVDYQKVASAVVGTSADATLYTTTVAANTMAAGKGIRITYCSKHTTGSASVSYKIFFGATSFAPIAASTGTNLICSFVTVFNNPGVTNAQQILQVYAANGSSLQAPSLTTAAEDTTASVVVKATFNVASTDQVTPESWLIETIQ